MRARYLALRPFVDERQRRLFAAAEARSGGLGWVSGASRATGIARSTIDRALDDLDAGLAADDRVRRVGGGRKELTTIDPELVGDLERIVAPTTRGDPEQPLRWTIKSLRQIAKALNALGHRISHTKVGGLLRRLGYSLQANRKTREGTNHPDRNRQFEYLNDTVGTALAEGQPAIS